MAIINQLDEVSYEFNLNEQGIARLTSQQIIGELRAIIFRFVEAPRGEGEVEQPEKPNYYDYQNYAQGIKVSMGLKEVDCEIFNENIYKDAYYALKVQPRDGFGQYWAQTSEFYLLNDSIDVVVQGAPGVNVEITFRWLNYA